MSLEVGECIGGFKNLKLCLQSVRAAGWIPSLKWRHSQIPIELQTPLTLLARQ